MRRVSALYHYFTRTERLLWLGSAAVVAVFYAVFDGEHIPSLQVVSYLSVLVCFVVFLVNDIYSFFSWQRIRARQQGR